VSTAKGRPAYAKPLRQTWNRWLVSRSLGEGCRLFSTFPFNFFWLTLTAERVSLFIVCDYNRITFEAIEQNG